MHCSTYIRVHNCTYVANPICQTKILWSEKGCSWFPYAFHIPGINKQFQDRSQIFSCLFKISFPYPTNWNAFQPELGTFSFILQQTVFLWLQRLQRISASKSLKGQRNKIFTFFWKANPRVSDNYINEFLCDMFLISRKIS